MSKHFLERKSYNYLVPDTSSLPLEGRIVNHGATIFK